jgi:SLT domain-containing protein
MHNVSSGAANTGHVSSGGGHGGMGSSGGPPSGAMPTGDKAKWIQEAMDILKAQGVDTSQIDPRDLEAMIDHESGGDPHAINLWDSNAEAGHPSKGLMQCIDSTFDAYKVPGHEDIWNPVDNIVAATRYSIDRYGSVNGVPGVEGLRSGSGYVGY